MAADGGHFRHWHGAIIAVNLLRPTCLILAAAAGGCAPAPVRDMPAERRISAADLQSDLLAAHNPERALVGVPPLRWDPGLAASAAQHARMLAATGSLRHSTRSARAGQGENLWMGSRGAFAPTRMAASWTAEKAVFRRGIFPAVSRTGNWMDVGHYSQMIWPTTTRLGCAIASSRRDDFLVCRYAPAGNIDGRRVP